jgi:hypothetical protein
MTERTDQELIDAFTRCALPPSEFRHREHVRVAWYYLQREPLGAAIARFSEDLRRFATANGAAGVYHETITWAFVVVINERLERTGRERSFAEFAAENADLFEKSCLLRYYDPSTLASPLAKKTFILPCNDPPRPA